MYLLLRSVIALSTSLLPILGVCLPGLGANTELMLLVALGRAPTDSTAGEAQWGLSLPLGQGCPCPAQPWPHWSRAWPPTQGPMSQPGLNLVPGRCLMSRAGAAPEVSCSLAEVVGQPWLLATGGCLLTGFCSVTAWFKPGFFEQIQTFPPPHEHMLCTHVFLCNAMLFF